MRLWQLNYLVKGHTNCTNRSWDRNASVLTPEPTVLSHGKLSNWIFIMLIPILRRSFREARVITIWKFNPWTKHLKNQHYSNIILHLRQVSSPAHQHFESTSSMGWLAVSAIDRAVQIQCISTEREIANILSDAGWKQCWTTTQIRPKVGQGSSGKKREDPLRWRGDKRPSKEKNFNDNRN